MSRLTQTCFIFNGNYDEHHLYEMLLITLITSGSNDNVLICIIALDSHQSNYVSHHHYRHEVYTKSVSIYTAWYMANRSVKKL